MIKPYKQTNGATRRARVVIAIAGGNNRFPTPKCICNDGATKEMKRSGRGRREHVSKLAEMGKRCTTHAVAATNDKTQQTQAKQRKTTQTNETTRATNEKQCSIHRCIALTWHNSDKQVRNRADAVEAQR